MSLAYGINKITATVATNTKKKHILTAFLEKYSALLDTICVELDNDINMATIITISNSIKKRNPKLIIDIWYKNVARRFGEMQISRQNFAEKSFEFMRVMQEDTYFSESMRSSTEKLHSKIENYLSTHEITPEIFAQVETVIKLAILYHSP